MIKYQNVHEVKISHSSSTCHQGYGPRDCSLGLENTRDQFYVVLVMILMVSILKGRFEIFSRPVVIWLFTWLFWLFLVDNQPMVKKLITYFYTKDFCHKCTFPLLCGNITLPFDFRCKYALAVYIWFELTVLILVMVLRAWSCHCWS